MNWLKGPSSLLSRQLLFLGLPLVVLWGFSAFSSYISAMNAATQAFDRMLLASTRTVAERLVVRNGRLQVDVPWVVLDSFERNMDDRLYYKVVDTEGRVISGYDSLPDIPGGTLRSELYPALAWFWHTRWRGQGMRVACLLQPVNEGGINGMVRIYVAETLQSRREMAANLLASSLWTQGGLVILTLILSGWLLRRVLRPLRRLSAHLARRQPGDLSALPALLPWSETRPLMSAFNRYLERLRHLIARQARFSADASHQLKTPLTVLKTQVAVALASQDPQVWRQSLEAMSGTLDGTVQLTERLLQLASLKRREPGSQAFTRIDLVALAQACCFSRLTQARSRRIDLGYEGETSPVWIDGEELLLAEMCANLLDNALKYTPTGGTVTVRVVCQTPQALLEVEDSGPGIDEHQTQQALTPFRRLEQGTMQQGAGLGLALVNDIARWHRTRPELLHGETLGGLLVRVRLMSREKREP
jgi:two-component system sensor histidine kinase TctE